MARTHAILVTHTPERIRRTILGCAWSSAPPATITIACDTDDDAIAGVARDAIAEVDSASQDHPDRAPIAEITLVGRAHAGVSRSAQTRNNGVRALLEQGADDDDALVFLDGDCVPAHDAFERHARALESGDLVIGWRFDLTPEQTRAFDEGALRSGRLPVEMTAEQTDAIDRRHARYQRQHFWRRFGLAKPHKPKVLSANFACRVSTFKRVNGFDETYEGWGQEDDDFGRRVYAAGGRPFVGVRDILAYHQHHPTRAPGEWHEGVNAERLHQPAAVVCEHGLNDPLKQGAIQTIRVCPAAVSG